MKTQNDTLNTLRQILAARKARKWAIARLLRNKANAMEAVYGFAASLNARRAAAEAEMDFARQRG